MIEDSKFVKFVLNNVVEEEIYKEEKDLDLPNSTGLNSSKWLYVFADSFDYSRLRQLIDLLNNSDYVVTKLGYDNIGFPVFNWEKKKEKKKKKKK